MDHIEELSAAFEYIKPDSVVAESLHATGRVERPAPGGVHQEKIESETAGEKADSPSEDREQQLDRWMEEVKAFIRSIDISAL